MSLQKMNRRHHLILHTVNEFVPFEYDLDKEREEKKINDDIEIIRNDRYITLAPLHNLGWAADGIFVNGIRQHKLSTNYVTHK